MTHNDLVKKARLWLDNSMECTVVLSELTTINPETPDGLGFKSVGGESILVECKATRADFIADKKKFFRRNEWAGMGDRRFFMVPKNLISPLEVPDPWGLVEVYPDSKIAKITKEAIRVEESNKTAEVTMLVSVIRRLEISTAVFVRHEDICQSITRKSTQETTMLPRLADRKIKALDWLEENADDFVIEYTGSHFHIYSDKGKLDRLGCGRKLVEAIEDCYT